jgi:NADH-quinone oxidoreductase subunit G
VPKVSGQERPKTFTVEIDGKSISAKPGQMLIQVADENNIYIPRFCYHKKLSIAANCRMCLVDVEGARKPSPACATPISDGMKVFTKSPKTLAYQKAVMEFLLINHPLDCPICDQGGECELQDVAMGYGRDISDYVEKKRVLADPDLGPLVATEMTRCICCTRCVRFGEEVSGQRELGGTDRGDRTKIGTYIEKTLDSEISGNVIDVCPVGALTSKPFRFEARAWELQQYPTISHADSVGANIYMHTRRGKVFRVVPQDNEAVNEVWLADRDRFAYEGLNSQDRITQPMIKKNDDWVSVSWEEALDFVKTSLEHVIEKSGADKISALASESCTTEEYYLLQKLMRQLGSNNLDSRIKQGQLETLVTAGNGIDCNFEEIEKADLVLLVGSNLRKELPLVNHRVRKATLSGAKVFAINPSEFDFNYDVDVIKTHSVNYPKVLLSLAKALHDKKPGNIRAQLSKLYESVEVTAQIAKLADDLRNAENPIILVGQKAIPLPNFGNVMTFFSLVKELSEAKCGVLSFGSNAIGAKNTNFMPYGDTELDNGLNVRQILSDQEGLEATILFNVEIEKDSIYGSEAIETLRKRDFVISVNTFVSEDHKSYADVILPITPFTETEGSFINYYGLSQSFKPVVKPLGDSKPGWKVIRVLGSLMDLSGFGYNSVEEIQSDFSEVKIEMPTFSSLEKNIYNFENYVSPELSISVNYSLYSVDMLTRRSGPLALTKDHINAQKIYVSEKYAEKNQLVCGEIAEFNISGKSCAKALVEIDKTLADSEVIVPEYCYSAIGNRSAISIQHMQEETA